MTGDNSVEWSTPKNALIALACGGVALGIAGIFVPTDLPGRALVCLAAVGLLVIAALGSRQRPRLAVLSGSPARLLVGRLRGPVEFDRTDIARARIVSYPRLGRRVPMLEIDVRRPGDDDDRLMIFGRWDLGTHPGDVLEVLDAHGLVPAGSDDAS